MQTDRGTRSRPIIEGQEGAQRSCVCRARSFALRRRPARHPASAGKGDRGTREILRSNRCSGIKEITVSGLARPGQGHQNDKEARPDIGRLPARAIEELEKFFEATDALESKKLQFQGWRGPARAIKTIKKLALTSGVCRQGRSRNSRNSSKQPMLWNQRNYSFRAGAARPGPSKR